MTNERVRRLPREEKRRGRADFHGREAPRHAGEPWWHWLIAGVGALLVVGTTGYLAYRGFSASDSPPDVVLEVQRVTPVADGYFVLLEAYNRGGRTAAGLEIRGELVHDGRILGESRLTIDYLPADSSKRGGLFFASDPRDPGTELRLEPSGFVEP